MRKKKHIWSAAQNMIDRFGDDALRQVEVRIDELRQHDMEDALKLWLEIRSALRLLAKTSANGSER